MNHCMRTLAAGVLLGFAFGASPALAQFDDPTVGPTTNVAPDEKAEPLAMPTKIPPVSSGADLVAYRPDGASTRQHWLDRRSITIEEPYVRATVVVESSSGARTVSHYGFDCANRSLALFAMGGRDGSWREVDSVAWRPLTEGRRNTPYLTAIYEAVCDGGGPVRTVDLMIERLVRPRIFSPY